MAVAWDLNPLANGKPLERISKESLDAPLGPLGTSNDASRRTAADDVSSLFPFLAGEEAVEGKFLALLSLWWIDACSPNRLSVVFFAFPKHNGSRDMKLCSPLVVSPVFSISAALVFSWLAVAG
ncbi:hypothetical protein UY3_12678 [Chelonia mydas]|uniref:Uncharacterized protein n=1 Tax=Chelonia mydas TaxID=8469 RepID=M7AZM5_CHEMY|nr:hypothetical protein UY3_12678 [Chelonia mydas]